MLNGYVVLWLLRRYFQIAKRSPKNHTREEEEHEEEEKEKWKKHTDKFH